MKNQRGKPGRLFQLALNDAFQSRLVPSFDNELGLSKKNKRNVVGENGLKATWVDNTNSNVSHVSEKVPVFCRIRKGSADGTSDIKQMYELPGSVYCESQNLKSSNCLLTLSHPDKNILESSHFDFAEYDLPCLNTNIQNPNTSHLKENHIPKSVLSNGDFNKLSSLNCFTNQEPATLNNDLSFHVSPEHENRKFDFVHAAPSWESSASSYDLPICHAVSEIDKINNIDLKNESTIKDFSGHHYQKSALTNHYQKMKEITSDLNVFSNSHSTKKATVYRQCNGDSILMGDSIPPPRGDIFNCNEQNNSLCSSAKFNSEAFANKVHRKHLNTSGFETKDIKPAFVGSRSQFRSFGGTASSDWNEVCTNIVKNNGSDRQTEQNHIKPSVSTHLVYSTEHDSIGLSKYSNIFNTNSVKTVAQQTDETLIKPLALKDNLICNGHTISSDFNTNIMRNGEINLKNNAKNQMNQSTRFLHPDLLNNSSTSQSNVSLLHHFDSLIYNADSMNTKPGPIVDHIPTPCFLNHSNIPSPISSTTIQFSNATGNAKTNGSNNKAEDRSDSSIWNFDSNMAVSNFTHPNAKPSYSDASVTEPLNLDSNQTNNFIPVFNYMSFTKSVDDISSLKPSEISKLRSKSTYGINGINKKSNQTTYNLCQQDHFSSSGSFLSDSKIDFLKSNIKNATGTRFDEVNFERVDRCSYSNNTSDDLSIECNSTLPVPSKIILKHLNINPEAKKHLSLPSNKTHISLVHHFDKELRENIDPPVGLKVLDSQCLVDKSTKQINSAKFHDHSTTFDPYFREDAYQTFDKKFCYDLEDSLMKSNKHSKLKSLKKSVSPDFNLRITSDDGWDDDK